MNLGVEKISDVCYFAFNKEDGTLNYIEAVGAKIFEWNALLFFEYNEECYCHTTGFYIPLSKRETLKYLNSKGLKYVEQRIKMKIDAGFISPSYKKTA